MKVVIDDKSGFCFGVVKAIGKAQALLESRSEVYSLGDIVHNRIEMTRLEQMGLRTVDTSDMEGLRGKCVLIRAHGEPPSTYEKARELGLQLIDATCPVVANLQKTVREAWEEMQCKDGQVVILGKRGHAEVVGLSGQVGGDVIVVETPADLAQIDFARPVYLLSQTTQPLELFEEIKNEIIVRSGNRDVTVNDTICRQVSNRSPHLKQFAALHDVIVFVSGRESSNGRVLFEICRQANSRSYKIEDEQELHAGWFEGAESVGICGATSTPKWLMEQVARAIENNRYNR